MENNNTKMKQLFILKEPKGKISSPTEVFKKIQKINIDFNQENFILIGLNTSNQIILKEVVFKGIIDSCIISNQTIFRKALLKNCAKIIIAHNHPSNNLNPSQEDKEIYKRVKEGGEVIGIKVLDNIIFNKKEFYSFNESEGF